MAVRLDVDTVRDAVDPAAYQAAESLLAAGLVGEVTGSGGGAVATVTAGEPAEPPDLDRFETWVGVVAGEFTAECGCTPDGAGGDEVCVHAVAVTLAALDAELPWSSAAVPPSGIVDPEGRRLAAVAAQLPPRRLAQLVGEYAAAEPRLAARLMAWAGLLGPADAEELHRVRQIVVELADEAIDGEFELHDVIRAGEQIVEVLWILAEQPPTDEALELVEYAAVVWDEIAVHLHDAGGRYPEEADAVGAALRDVHLGMCTELEPAPEELAERLRRVIERAEAVSCLDEPEEYAALLGAELTAALQPD